MKLYYSPGACSLATRISLHEAGITAEFERVDLKAGLTERGAEFAAVNPGGYVPVLVLDDGASVIENVAVLDLISGRALTLAPNGPMGRTRLVEMLSFLSTEVHAAFKPFWHDATEAEKARAGEAVAARLDIIERGMKGPYLFGPRFTVADAYLFVMLRWAKGFGVRRPPRLAAWFDRVLERDAVRQALAEEGLAERAAAEAAPA